VKFSLKVSNKNSLNGKAVLGSAVEKSKTRISNQVMNFLGLCSSPKRKTDKNMPAFAPHKVDLL